MSEPLPDLEQILASVADGKPVAWEELLAASDPGTRTHIEALGAVSRIAEFNRALQRGEAPVPLPAGGDVPRWGSLLLLERIGEGTRAEVYRAWDPGLRREVALKLMRPEQPDPAGESLLREGQCAARVRHPHVVAVHGVDRHDGRVGFWMEYLRGTTLEAEVSDGGPLEPARVLRLGLDLASALASIHAAGLLHRDVKPANVSRDGSDRYVLTDFGLGAGLDGTPAAPGPSGTPMYMAPELFAGEPPSARSDVYALGLTLWYALAGRHPFAATTLGELTRSVGEGVPPLDTIRSGIPGRLVAAIRDATAPDPAGRPSTAEAFLARLRDADRGATSRRVGRPALVGVGVALLAVVGWFLVRPGGEGSSVPPVAGTAVDYDVEASFLRYADRGPVFLENGDRVAPGDRLGLRLRVSRSAWVYVLNEDETGEAYLLFPQPRFDLANPLPADSAWVLPGSIGGTPFAWTVTSAGGREQLLVAVSPSPVPELEAALGRIPSADPGRPVTYPEVAPGTLETLRGVGGLQSLPDGTSDPDEAVAAFHRFPALAGPESGVEGVWVRRVTLENPRRPGGR